MRQFKPLWIAAIALFTFALWTVPGEALAQNILQDIAAASTIEDIKKRGTMRVGVSAFVPWVMRDKAGKLVGFEVDVSERLAKDMKIKLELVPTAFDGIIAGLLGAKFDVIITGISVRTQRALSINYTIPYARSGQVLVGSKKLTAGMSTLEDFNNASVSISSRRGSVGSQAAKKLFPKAAHLHFDDDPSVFQEVLNGKAHAAIALEPIPTQWVLANLDALNKPLGQRRLTTQIASFAIRKGDPDFMFFLNSYIEQIKADGWLEERHNFWFATDAWYGLINNPPGSKG